MPAPTQASIRVVKTSPYKGGTKTWSNRYFFNGSDPSGSAAWAALAALLEPWEKPLITSASHIVEYIGYNAGSDVPVWSSSVSVAGTGTYGDSALIAPLECCALTKFTTTQRTSKNHPIYLFKYRHDVAAALGSDRELLHNDVKTNIQDYDAHWVTGFLVDGTTRPLTGPRGAVAQTRIVETYLTHRDFPT